MNFKEIASRLTGISCPVFGVSWDPPKTDISACRRILTYLEDRRVLYVPSEAEIPSHCVHSIIEIRRFITNELLSPDLSRDTSASLKALRTACRKFLSRVQEDEKEIVTFANHHGHYASWIFHDALGQLRATFGIHLAQLAVKHGLDVEDDLAQIFPEKDNEETVEQSASHNGGKPPRES